MFGAWSGGEFLDHFRSYLDQVRSLRVLGFSRKKTFVGKNAGGSLGLHSGLFKKMFYVFFAKNKNAGGSQGLHSGIHNLAKLGHFNPNLHLSLI